MKGLNYLFFIILIFNVTACDDDCICVYGQRDVVVKNNTGYQVDVIADNNFSWVFLGSLPPFDKDEYSVNVPNPNLGSVFITGGNDEFTSLRTYVDPCLCDSELVFVIED